ncbi:hypothetical protein U0L13_001880 [Providencia stuartii]|nr:hypothetical protein [Providencia stuartii]
MNFYARYTNTIIITHNCF